MTTTCWKCPKPATGTIGGPPLTPEEQAEVAAYHASFTAPDGSPIYHTGHLDTRLLRLPIHPCCDQHR